VLTDHRNWRIDPRTIDRGFILLFFSRAWIILVYIYIKQKIPFLLVRKRTIPTERPMRPAKLMPTFFAGRCCVTSTADPNPVNSVFLDRTRYISIQVAPQLSTRGWVDPVPDPLFLRKSGSARNQTRPLWVFSQELWPLDHRGDIYHRLCVSRLFPEIGSFALWLHDLQASLWEILTRMFLANMKVHYLIHSLSLKHIFLWS
jgi:hypothetical protein